MNSSSDVMSSLQLEQNNHGTKLFKSTDVTWTVTLILVEMFSTSFFYLCLLIQYQGQAELFKLNFVVLRYCYSRTSQLVNMKSCRKFSFTSSIRSPNIVNFIMAASSLTLHS